MTFGELNCILVTLLDGHAMTMTTCRNRVSWLRQWVGKKGAGPHVLAGIVHPTQVGGHVVGANRKRCDALVGSVHSCEATNLSHHWGGCLPLIYVCPTQTQLGGRWVHCTNPAF